MNLDLSSVPKRHCSTQFLNKDLLQNEDAQTEDQSGNDSGDIDEHASKFLTLDKLVGVSDEDLSSKFVDNVLQHLPRPTPTEWHRVGQYEIVDFPHHSSDQNLVFGNFLKYALNVICLFFYYFFVINYDWQVVQ